LKISSTIATEHFACNSTDPWEGDLKAIVATAGEFIFTSGCQVRPHEPCFLKISFTGSNHHHVGLYSTNFLQMIVYLMKAFLSLSLAANWASGLQGDDAAHH
jgi:hypothetical protein